MEDTFEEKIENRKKRQMAIKYYLPTGMGFCLLLILVQIAVQLTPLARLNNKTGVVTGLRTEIESWTHSRLQKKTANYGLFLTLNDNLAFIITEVPYRQMLAEDLKIKDSITVYYPNRIMTDVPLLFLKNEICQVERTGVVLFGWEEKKARDRDLIYFLVAIIVGCYIIRRYYIVIDK